METTLDKLRKGEKAVVESITESNISLRLLEIGVFPGTEIVLKSVSPLKSSFIIDMGDFSLSIRKDDAKHIIVSHYQS